MESTTCPECTNEIADGDTECPRCGTPVAVNPQPPPLMSVIAEPQPPASTPLVIATRVAAVVLVGWLATLAVFTWLAYREGYVDTLLPAWNTLFVVGTLPVVAGVFARRMWAQRWAFGIALFTGLGNALQASRADSNLLWIGALLLGAVVIVFAKARPIFRHDASHRGTLAQLIATIVTVGSIFIYFTSMNSQGTERGRVAFAAEVQQSYEKAGVGTVRVYIEGRSLIIEGKSDTDEQIDEAAQLMTAQLRSAGRNAKAWVLGFENIKLTNGSHTRLLAPSDPP